VCICLESVSPLGKMTRPRFTVAAGTSIKITNKTTDSKIAEDAQTQRDYIEKVGNILMQEWIWKLTPEQQKAYKAMMETS